MRAAPTGIFYSFVFLSCLSIFMFLCFLPLILFPLVFVFFLFVAMALYFLSGLCYSHPNNISKYYLTSSVAQLFAKRKDVP